MKFLRDLNRTLNTVNQTTNTVNRTRNNVNNLGGRNRNRAAGNAANRAQAVQNASWDCACGNKRNEAKFCEKCGGAKPACPGCGNFDITKDTKFCGECGCDVNAPAQETPDAVAAVPTCPGCNIEVAADTKFCGECGHNVSNPNPAE